MFIYVWNRYDVRIMIWCQFIYKEMHSLYSNIFNNPSEETCLLCFRGILKNPLRNFMKILKHCFRDWHRIKLISLLIRLVFSLRVGCWNILDSLTLTVRVTWYSCSCAVEGTCLQDCQEMLLQKFRKIFNKCSLILHHEHIT